MANRGRDLTFSILSDSDKFDLSEAADELEDLGSNAGDTTRELDGLQEQARRMRLDALEEDARGAAREVETLGDNARRADLEDTLGRDAKATARKVDDAFDTIARASRTSSRKVETETRDIRDNLRDVGDEAGQTARESAASFSSSGDIGDAFQELAANAGVAFGPIGLALGAAAAVGVGLFRTESEKIRDEVEELVDEMIEQGGRLSTEFIDNKIAEMAKSGELQRLRDLVEASDIAGVSFRDLARAKAGEEEAIQRVNDALDLAAPKYADMTDEAGNYNGVNDLMRARIKVLRGELGDGTKALELAKEATEDYTSATANAGASAVTNSEQAGAAWDTLSGRMRDPITGEIRIRKPSSSTYRNVRRDLADGIGPIVVDVIANPRTDLFYPGRTRP